MNDTYLGIIPRHTNERATLFFMDKLCSIKIHGCLGGDVLKLSLLRWPLSMLLVVVALQSESVGAAEADSVVYSHSAPQRSAMVTPIGKRTAQLLELQRGNSAAAPRRPMLGPVAEVVWQRYLKSFRHPVPDLYRDADASIRR